MKSGTSINRIRLLITNDTIEHLSCTTYNDKLSVVMNKEIYTIVFNFQDNMTNKDLLAIGDMKQSEGVKAFDYWVRPVICSITIDATIQCNYVSVYTSGTRKTTI